MLSGLGTDLAPRGFCGFLSAAVWPFGSPAPSRGFKPPARTPVQAAQRGPRVAPEGSATFSSGRESRRGAPLGRRTTSRCGWLPQLPRGAMGGALVGPSVGGQVLREGRAALQTLPSCHRPLAAVGPLPAPRRLPLRWSDAEAPPRHPRPRVVAACPGVEVPRAGSRPAVAEAAACGADGSRLVRAGA